MQGRTILGRVDVNAGEEGGDGFGEFGGFADFEQGFGGDCIEPLAGEVCGPACSGERGVRRPCRGEIGKCSCVEARNMVCKICHGAQ